MRTLQFNFCHPVKGQVKLSSPACPLQSKIMPFTTGKGQAAEIIIDGLICGNWIAALEWEYEGRNFFMQKEFCV